MKLILVSVLTVGLQQWLPLTTLGACPKEGNVKAKVVKVTKGGRSEPRVLRFVDEGKGRLFILSGKRFYLADLPME